jgi:hypothetical protein
MLGNKINLKELSDEQLNNLQTHLDRFLFSQPSVGEPFHPDYKKDKKAFKKFIHRTTKLKASLDRFFQAQWENVGTLVNLYKVMGSVEDDFINEAQWKMEDGKLVVEIELNLADIFEIGSEAALKQFNFDIGVDRNDLTVQKFLSNYELKLAGQINQTTKDRIIEQLKTSIKLGESRDKLVSRLQPVVLDTKRAVRIAQTESVRAFAQGKLMVGHRLGVKKKKWVTYIAEDVACVGAADQGPIDINMEFENGRQAPPAHPHCRCLLELVYDPATDTLNWDATGGDLQDYNL